MQADKVTRKVIILAICEKLDSLTRQELMETALESMYMDYFQFIELLDELLQEKLLAAAQRKGESRLDARGRAPERFSLTRKGLLVLDTLRDKMPVPVTAYLHRALLARESELKQENSLSAVYNLMPNGRYEVTLELFDQGDRYFSCRLDVPNQTMARGACDRWKTEAGKLYPEFLRLLLKPHASADEPASDDTSTDTE